MDKFKNGFTLIRKRQVDELDSTLWELKHDKTGLDLIWLENREENKHFSIAFKTVPDNDTGVFHILEHSVLNGSEHYNIKDPFLHLLKSSMNTFLNAMTSRDYTIFPVSSRNETDYFNLTDVYLDSVFNPLIYTNPNILYQEGWHSEFDEDGHLFDSGVVLNEMRGAFSSPDQLLKYEIGRMLYPDTTYKYEPGGRPCDIVDLKYEDFLKYHKKYYHPSNAVIYLDGDIDIDRMLDLVDKYISKYDKKEIRVNLEEHNVLHGDRIVRAYQGDEEDGCYYTFAKLILKAGETVKRSALNIILFYLTCDNDAPLKSLLLSKGLCSDVYAYIDDSAYDEAYVLTCKNVDPQREDELCSTIEDFFEEFLETGFDHDLIKVMISQMEFKSKEQSEPKAIGRNLNMLSHYLYGLDPLEPLIFTDLFNNLKELVDDGYYEELFRTIPFKRGDVQRLILIPDEMFDEKELNRENKRLSDKLESMTDEDKKELILRNNSLIKYQSTENTIEELSCLPTLDIKSISTEIDYLKPDSVDDIIYYHISGKGITYINLYFSLTGISEDDYYKMSLLTNLLGELKTKDSELSDLKFKIRDLWGMYDFNVSSYGHETDLEMVHPYFVVSLSVLDEKVEDSIHLLNEILTKTDFDSDDTKDLVADIVGQCMFTLSDSITQEGQRFANYMAASHISANGKALEKFLGYSMYSYIKDMFFNFDEMYESFALFMKKVQKDVFCLNNVKISIGCSDKNEVQACIKKTFCINEDINNPEFIKLDIDRTVKNELIVIPGKVSYTVLFDDMRKYGFKGTWKMKALGQLLSLDHLWNEIRVKNGAYGCGVQMSYSGSFSMYSYRDTVPDKTVEAYRASADYLKQYVLSDSNFDNIKISTISIIEQLVDTRTLMDDEDINIFTNISEDLRSTYKKELLDMKKSELAEYVDLIDSVTANGCICTVGPEHLAQNFSKEQIHYL